MILALTVGYAIFEKNKIEILTKEAESPILKALPDFQFNNFFTGEIVEKNNYLSKYTNGVFIHFWGTWCGPCEAELPDFFSFSKKFKNENVGFLIIAVNDKDKKIKKFMKRFKDLPKNVTLVHDKTGQIMSKFGTVKVPETYLFNNTGKHLNKYIGPQSWISPGFVKLAAKYLSL